MDIIEINPRNVELFIQGLRDEGVPEEKLNEIRESMHGLALMGITHLVDEED